MRTLTSTDMAHIRSKCPMSKSPGETLRARLQRMAEVKQTSRIATVPHGKSPRYLAKAAGFRRCKVFLPENTISRAYCIYSTICPQRCIRNVAAIQSQRVTLVYEWIQYKMQPRRQFMHVAALTTTVSMSSGFIACDLHLCRLCLPKGPTRHEPSAQSVYQAFDQGGQSTCRGISNSGKW